MKSIVLTITSLVLALSVTFAPAQDAQLKSAQMEADRAEMELRQHQQMIEKEREALLTSSGLVSITPEGLRGLVQRLQDEKEAMQVEEAGAKGRQDAIAKAIAETTDRVKLRAASDDVTAELEKVVATRQKQLDRLKALQAAAAVANGEVDAAEAALATARAEAAASRQKIAGASTDLLEALNRELINLTIGRQERAAKKEYIESRLKQLQPAMAEAHHLETMLHDLARAERYRDSAFDQLQAIRRVNGQ